MRTVLFVFLSVLFVCCSHKKRPLLNPGNLPVFSFRADAATDTVLQTPKGALLKIRKGTFAEPVELEVREAYTMADILLAGLTTESNGRPLRSGGMIYVGAKGGKEGSLMQPIGVAIPAAFVDTAMQVFKGEAKDGSMNWNPVDTLTQTPQIAMIEQGRQLFQQQCATCHDLNKNLTGPALAGFKQRGPWKDQREVWKWVTNPARYMASDAYTYNLKNGYGAIMQAFPDLTPDAVRAVTAYIMNETGNPKEAHSWLNEKQQLMSDEEMIDWAKDRKATDTCMEVFEEDSVIAALSPLGEQDTTTIWPSQATSPAPVPALARLMEKEIPLPEPPPGAYTFEMRSLGWYNIDAFVKPERGTVDARLVVRVQPAYLEEHLFVKALFHEEKVMLDGLRYKEQPGFSFGGAGNGKLPLPLGADGLVLGYGERNDTLFAGTLRFAAKKEQELVVRLKPISEEALLELIRSQKLEGVELGLKKRRRRVEHYPCEAGGVLSAFNGRPITRQ